MKNTIFLAILFLTLGMTAQTTTNYEYDKLYRLKVVTFPSGSTITYNYDANGNRSQEVRVFSNLSVETVSDKKSILVYPNPFFDVLTIETKEDNLQSIQLIDLLGKTIKQEKVSGNSYQLNLENLPQAVYILEVVSDKGLQRVKVVKK